MPRVVMEIASHVKHSSFAFNPSAWSSCALRRLQSPGAIALSIVRDCHALASATLGVDFAIAQLLSLGATDTPSAGALTAVATSLGANIAATSQHERMVCVCVCVCMYVCVCMAGRQAKWLQPMFVAPSQQPCLFWTSEGTPNIQMFELHCIHADRGSSDLNHEY